MLRQVAARYRPLMGVGLAAALIAPGVALADKKKDDEPRGPVFDPEALERGAKALREINASPHSKQVRDRADAIAKSGRRVRWQPNTVLRQRRASGLRSISPHASMRCAATSVQRANAP